jgi:alpha-L-fucosidase 2
MCPVCGAWLALLLWDHYMYTADMGYLRHRALPVLRGAVRFFHHYLFALPSGAWPYMLTRRSRFT